MKDKLNIPTYRAKKIDSDEYVTGYLTSQSISEIEPEYIIQSANNFKCEYIDPSTLAIHFPDMKDSENNPIFASLDKEKSIGGDMCEHDDNGFTYNANSVIYEKGTICFKDDYSNLLNDYKNLKIIGIQK